ncbi:hypothetical protein HDU81_008281 [Chytriomyces hyalinus]|nr:hypothetical protein HDU81_008281 [Chytriomyces hyalinus]
MNSEWEQYYLAAANTEQHSKEQYSEEYKERHRLAWAHPRPVLLFLICFDAVTPPSAKAAIVNPFAPPIPVPTESNSQPQTTSTKPTQKKKIIFDPSKPKKMDPVRQEVSPPPPPAAAAAAAVDNHIVNTDSNTAPTTNDCVSDSSADCNVNGLAQPDLTPPDGVESNCNNSCEPVVQERVASVEPMDAVEHRPSNILKLVLKPTTELRLKEPIILSADEQALSEFDRRIEAEENALQTFIEEQNRAIDRIQVLIEARRGQCEQRVGLLRQAKEEERERRETRRRLEEEKRISLETEAELKEKSSVAAKNVQAEPTEKLQPKRLDASDSEMNVSTSVGEKKRGIGGRDGGPRLYLPSEHDIRQMQQEEQKAKELASYVKSTLPRDGYRSRYRHDNADNSYSANDHSSRRNAPYHGRYGRNGGVRGEHGRIVSRSPSPSYRRRSGSRNLGSRSSPVQKYRSNSRPRSQSRSVSPFLREGSRPSRESVSQAEQRRGMGSLGRTGSPPPRLLSASLERGVSTGTVPIAPPPPPSLQITTQTVNEGKGVLGDPVTSPFSDVDLSVQFQQPAGETRDSYRKRRSDHDSHAEDGESVGRSGKKSHRHHHRHHREQRGHRDGHSRRHSSHRHSREKGEAEAQQA